MTGANLARVLVAAVLVSTMSGCNRISMHSLGGPWYEYSHPQLPEAGFPPHDLYRSWGRQRVLIAKDVRYARYYQQPGCMVWEPLPMGGAATVYAACAEHAPMVVAVDNEHRWKMGDRGLTDPEKDRLDSTGIPVRPTWIISLAAIAAAAVRQPAFNGPLTNTIPFGEDVQPVENVVPIDVNETDIYFGRTALLDAAALSQHEQSPLPLVHALLARGADVNAVDKFGNTALILAGGHAHADVVWRLLQSGADVHVRNSEGRTALMEAAGAIGDDQVEMVTWLLQAGADKTVRDKQGRTAYSAIRSNTDPQLKELLALQ